MEIKKNDCFGIGKEVYRVAGKWQDAYVLVPMQGGEDCLLYTQGEIQELLEEKKLHALTPKAAPEKAAFGRKLLSLEELKDFAADKPKGQGVAYTINKEVVMTEEEYKAFAENFLLDQPWITPMDGGNDGEGHISCIRVSCPGQPSILVNSEGYSYARYTALA